MKTTKAVLAVLLLIPSLALPCGWSDDGPSFTVERQPENLATFVAGDLGFLRPSMRPGYLVPAYRILTGAALTPPEQQRLTEALSAREPDEVDGETVWLKARAAVMKGHEPEQGRPNYYASFLNCPPDAFLTAAATLEKRKTAYPTDFDVNNWVWAQDQVFARCAETATGPIPKPLPDAEPLVKADRNYQIAAALFYSRDLDAAIAAFRAIAADPTSPWRQLAPYLEARAMVRKATIGDRSSNTLFSAEVALAHVKRRAAASPNDPNLQKLLSYIRVRARPAEAARVIATGFLKSMVRPALRQELIDFAFALENPVAGEVSSAGGDFADWACVMSRDCAMTAGASMTSAVDALAREGVATEKWKQTRAPHWLLAAVVLADGRGPETTAMLAAIDALPASWPGTRTALLEKARLLIALKQTPAARAALDALGGRTPGERNLINALRLEIPRDSLELAAAAAQTPVVGGALVCFPPRGADLLNRAIPLSELSAIVATGKVTGDVGRLLASTGFVRAALLDDETNARALMPAALTASPELATSVQSWAAAKTKDERAFAVAHLVLSQKLGPELRANRCFPNNAADSIRAGTVWSCGTTAAPASVEFLTAGERDGLERERNAFNALGGELDALTRAALTWAKAHPEDPRSAEALSRAVKLAHNHPCATGNSANLSRQAFRLLHRNFEKTAWAKTTPYWY